MLSVHRRIVGAMTAILGSFATTSPRIQRRHKSNISPVAPIRSSSSASSTLAATSSRNSTNAGNFIHPRTACTPTFSRAAIAFSDNPVADILAAYLCGSLKLTIPPILIHFSYFQE